MSLPILPNEVLFQMASFVRRESDILSLTLTNRRLYVLLIEYLYQYNIRENDSFGMVKAVRTRQVPAIKRFIEHDFDIFLDDAVEWRKNGEVVYGKNVVHIACEAKASLEVVALLLEAGVNVNDYELPCPSHKPFYAGYNPIQLAVFQKNVPVVRLLLSHGADLNLNLFYKNNHTHIIHAASFTGPLEMVQLLLDYGADAKMVDEFQRTPLHFAVGYQRRMYRGSYWWGDWADPHHNIYLTEYVMLQHSLGDVLPAKPRGQEKIARLLLDHGADAQA